MTRLRIVSILIAMLCMVVFWGCAMEGSTEGPPSHALDNIGDDTPEPEPEPEPGETWSAELEQRIKSDFIDFSIPMIKITHADPSFPDEWYLDLLDWWKERIEVLFYSGPYDGSFVIDFIKSPWQSEVGESHPVVYAGVSDIGFIYFLPTEHRFSMVVWREGEFCYLWEAEEKGFLTLDDLKSANDDHRAFESHWYDSYDEYGKRRNP